MEEFSSQNEKEIKAVIKISKEASLGQNELLVRTLNGISKLITFWVGPYPNVDEKNPIHLLEEAQLVPMNSTVNGVSLNEDVDFFEINATKGQRISAEVEAIRLSGPLFDPYVAILDENRFEIANFDDTELLLQDSTTSVLAPKTGKYYIEVRESSYRGNASFRYRLHLGSFPRPLVVSPSGGEAGKPTEFTFLGDPKGTFLKIIHLPDNGTDTLLYYHQEDGLTTPSPNKFVYQNFLRLEKLNLEQQFQRSNQEDSIPLAFDGVIQEKGDIDCFRFQAKKGDRYYIKAHARSVAFHWTQF